MSKKKIGSVEAEITDVDIKSRQVIVAVKFTENGVSWHKGFILTGGVPISAEKFFTMLEEQDIYPPKDEAKLIEDLKANIGKKRSIKIETKPVGD